MFDFHLGVQPIGCYKDKFDDRAFPVLIANLRDKIDWYDLQKTINECACYAYEGGYKVSSVQTILQYCCCLIAILTAWKTFLKISHREGSTRVRNDRDVMCLPAHDVYVIIFATFKMCYEHFHSTKLLHSSCLSHIL